MGWHITTQTPTGLVLIALEQALTLRQPAPRDIIHTDCGSQCTSQAYRARINTARAVPSLNRPCNPYDNAQAEAGWSKLKTELLLSGSPFASLEKVCVEVDYCLSRYFNLDRRHLALGYYSPYKFELNLKINMPSQYLIFTGPLQRCSPG